MLSKESTGLLRTERSVREKDLKVVGEKGDYKGQKHKPPFNGCMRIERASASK